MKESISNFEFRPCGYGHYEVTYLSPKTSKEWKRTISDMTIIDATKNADEPKQKDLKQLKRIVKSN